ncbi:response regulator [Trinickia symbiotica]|uniref:Response regulator n=1 Tax=Trinickia symbiotica TaxID=863227 RepID=A0A2T3XVL9_9BURK|nr:response regulator [Trinickia symbiotica]PTB20566.1 response regulator [Trinickia symbiotica]
MVIDMSRSLVDILLVEDSPSDAMMTREALLEYRVLNPLHVVEDGVAAMRYLKQRGPDGSARRPGLIILDLNLPKMSGREVLQELKRDPALSDIPVVVLTTSKAEEDVLRSYGLHANCYITKPVDFEKFTEVVRSISDFWFSVVTLPPVKP